MTTTAKLKPTKAQVKKAAKDKEHIAKSTARLKKDTVKAKSVATVLRVIDNTEETIQSLPATNSKSSRYRNPDVDYSMSIVNSELKPSAAKYAPNTATEELANTTANANSETLAKIISNLGKDLANTQGKLHCIMVGLAVRVQRDGESAVSFVNDFLNACQPWGNSLTMVRLGAIKTWFTEMVALKYEKGPEKGDGKLMLLDTEKRQKFGAKFGRNPDAWMKDRLAKPFWLVKPEPELKEFDIWDYLQEGIAKATKLKAFEDNPQEHGYKVIKLNGLEQLKKDIARLRNQYSTEEEENTKETNVA